MTVDRRDLGASFNEYFELVPAFDAATRAEVFRVRHEVYCRDLGWEPLREDGQERDAFDDQSLHCLLRRRGSGEPVGCTRLILTAAAQPDALLPFERSCEQVLHRDRVDPAKLPRAQVTEISRLAVMRSFRQRKGESGAPVALADEDFQPQGGQMRFPFIPVGLYMGVAAMAIQLGCDFNFVLTEPRLAAHFERIGFDIECVGSAIEHHGERAPYLLYGPRALVKLRPLVRPLYDVIAADVARAIAAHGLQRRA